MRSLNIQLLRALASLGVVGHHLIFYLQKYIAVGSYGGLPEVLASGVDVFFVVSGFLMAETALRKNEPGSFLRARIERVVPMYWIFTAVAALAAGVGLRIFALDGLSPQHLLESLFFLPPSGPGLSSFPILYVGWTLNYEMMFYGLFAISMWVPDEKSRLMTLFLLFGLLQVGGLIGGSLYLRYWGSPLVIEFALGVLLSLYARTYAFSPRHAFTAIVVSCGLLCATELLDTRMETHPLRFVLWGVPAALIVFSALSLEKHDKYVDRPWLTLLGDASFSIYLFHPFALQGVGKISLKIGLHGTEWLDCASVLCAAIVATAGGVLVHTQIEKPINAWLRRRRVPVRYEQRA